MGFAKILFCGSWSNLTSSAIKNTQKWIDTVEILDIEIKRKWSETNYSEGVLKIISEKVRLEAYDPTGKVLLMFSVTNDSYGKKNSPPSTVFSHIRTSHGVNSMYFNSMDQHNSEYVTSSPAHLFAGTRLPNTGTFHAVVNLPTSHRFSDFCYKEMLTNLFSFFQKKNNNNLPTLWFEA